MRDNRERIIERLKYLSEKKENKEIVRAYKGKSRMFEGEQKKKMLSKSRDAKGVNIPSLKKEHYSMHKKTY